VGHYGCLVFGTFRSVLDGLPIGGGKGEEGTFKGKREEGGRGEAKKGAGQTWPTQ